MAQARRRKRKAGEADHHDDERFDGSSVRGNQILPVATLPANFDGVPLDGSQYLAVVRRQASTLSAVTRSLAQSTPLGSVSVVGSPHYMLQSMQTDESDILPLNEWRSTFQARFRNMRASLLRRKSADGGQSIGVPQVANARKWFRFLYGVDPCIPNTYSSTPSLSHADDAHLAAFDVAQSKEPSTALLQHFYTTQHLALLNAFNTWILEDWTPRSALHNGPNGRQIAGAGEALDPFQSRWIFALLSHLDERLVGDDVSALRSLARTCIGRIANVRLQRQNSNDDDAAAAAAVANFDKEHGAWIVVCAIIGIWGQHDLWNDAIKLLTPHDSSS